MGVFYTAGGEARKTVPAGPWNECVRGEERRRERGERVIFEVCVASLTRCCGGAEIYATQSDGMTEKEL